MTRVDGGDRAPLVAEQAAQENQRLADLARARTLAAAAASALAPEHEQGPELLGRAIGEAQRLHPDARLEFVARLAGEKMPSTCPNPTPNEAVVIAKALIDECCPPKSERRQRLGKALQASAAASGSSTGSETAISQAMTRFLPVAIASRPATTRDDRLHRLEEPNPKHSEHAVAASTDPSTPTKQKPGLLARLLAVPRRWL